MTPRGLNVLAIVTLLATLPLLTLGAEVTTKGQPYAEVDKVGLREPWHMLTVPLGEWHRAWVVEHSHRTFGFFVGCCAIVLAVSLWVMVPGRAVCWLGTAALVGVSIQGLLGALRVNERSKELAMIHGLFAPLVIATLASVVWLTSRAGQETRQTPLDPRFRRASLVALGVVYLQMMLGALVRRHDFTWGARAHLLSAFVVVGVLVWLARRATDTQPAGWSLWLMFGFLGVQLFLGVEAWLSKFFQPGAPWNQLTPSPMHLVELRSLHYVCGTLLFATCAVLVLQAHRGLRTATQIMRVPARWEGAV